QAARFVWLTTPEARERLAALSSSTNADKIRKAPAAVIIGMDLAFNEQLPWLFPHAPTAKDWFPTEESRYTTAFRNSS
ncbi:nitroreductase family protein, partial [Escherichia coli]|nr:nitroreductase family protein [Escherichia coli]